MCFIWANQARKDRSLIFEIEKNAFWNRKVKFSKDRKNRNFPKGLVHGFWLKIEPFLRCIFWSNQARKDGFLIFWIEKNAV